MTLALAETSKTNDLDSNKVKSAITPSYKQIPECIPVCLHSAFYPNKTHGVAGNILSGRLLHLTQASLTLTHSTSNQSTQHIKHIHRVHPSHMQDRQYLQIHILPSHIYFLSLSLSLSWESSEIPDLSFFVHSPLPLRPPPTINQSQDKTAPIIHPSIPYQSFQSKPPIPKNNNLKKTGSYI